jgi:hypothetical protein
MELSFSKEFGEKFLFLFTQELIVNSGKKEIIKLQTLLEEKNNLSLNSNLLRREIVKKGDLSSVKTLTPFYSSLNMNLKRDFSVHPMIPHPIMNPTKKMLFIPESSLPKHLENLRPVPSLEKFDIDLGKINLLINDPAVQIIEGSPNEQVRVIGRMGNRITKIILTREDIEIILNKFSDLSKIPIKEGIYKVACGNLLLSAVVSEIIGSKFVIKKIDNFPLKPPTPVLNQQIIPVRRY